VLGVLGELPVFSFIADLPLASRACEYAQEMHRGQLRASDEAPFILHPLEVAALLHNTGHREAVVAVGILHDTIEDTSTHRRDIEARFGSEVAALVAALTEDPTIESFEKRKEALRAQIARFGADAVAVDAADKVAKVRELRAQAGREPHVLRSSDSAARLKLRHDAASLAMLEEAQPSHPLVCQLRFELEALRALPPRAVGAPAAFHGDRVPR
jgi:(p)ppGpp synthase/HD superfamily hydrolase